MASLQPSPAAREAACGAVGAASCLVRAACLVDIRSDVTIAVEDEEETIAEEEANEGAVDHQSELSNLAKEGRLGLLPACREHRVRTGS